MDRNKIMKINEQWGKLKKESHAISGMGKEF